MTRRMTILAGLAGGIEGLATAAQPLAQQLMSSRMALAAVTRDRLVFNLFDGSEFSLKFGPRNIRPDEEIWTSWHWSPNSRFLGLHKRGDTQSQPNEIHVVSAQGKLRWSSGEIRYVIISDLAVSLDGTRVAALARKLNGTTRLIVVSNGAVDEIRHWDDSKNQVLPYTTWVPGREAVGLTINGGVVILDVQGNSVDHLLAGTDPRWSPDGLRLAYISAKSRHLEVVSASKPDGPPNFSSRYPVLGGPSAIWAQDGQFLLCNEMPWRPQIFRSDVVVYRISDRARLKIRDNKGLPLKNDVAFLGDVHKFVAKVDAAANP